MPKKRGYHHGNLRQALVEAALELIEQLGPTGFTLSQAAKQAGVTPAAVYRHFEGREDLIAEAARQGYEIFADVMQYAYDSGQPSALAAFEATAAPIWPLPENIPAITSQCSKAVFPPIEPPVWPPHRPGPARFWKKRPRICRNTSRPNDAHRHRCFRRISGP